MDPASQMLLMESANNSANQDYTDAPAWFFYTMSTLYIACIIVMLYLLIKEVREGNV